MKLYGKGMSRSFRCVWAAEEAGLEYEYIDVEFGSQAQNGTASDDYRLLNSQGKVPTLWVPQNNGSDLVLSESAAIVNYLARRVPDKQLLPSSDDFNTLALYDQLAFFALSDLEQPLWTHGKHKFALPKEHRVSDVIKTTYWEFEKAQKALLVLMNDPQSYALGESFSVADILLAHTLSWGERFEYVLLPELKAYKDRMFSREACKAALAKIGVK